MSKNIVISVTDLHKEFKLPHQKVESIKTIFTSRFSLGRSTYETQVALSNISFDIKRGEFFGIVGRNGSGKSTLLKLLAGIYQPTKGAVDVSGRIVPFIELGVGFNGDLTGRENVYLNGALMGFSEKEIALKYNDIVEFAELERFMDQKLKNYSSGMQVRLAFSVATRLAESDILLIDEVLAVGDADFQRKCFNYFKQLKKEKKTVVFVTHDMNAVREYCDRAVLIDSSKLVSEGDPEKIATKYTRMFMKELDTQADEEMRWGEGKLKYESVTVMPKKIDSSIKKITITATYKVTESVSDPILGFSIKNSAGTTLLGTNTKLQMKNIPLLTPDEVHQIVWSVDNIFEDGDYSVSVAAVYPDGVTSHDWWDDAKVFRVFKDVKSPYIVAPNINVKVD